MKPPCGQFYVFQFVLAALDKHADGYRVLRSVTRVA